MAPKLDNDQRMFALRMYAETNNVGEVRHEIKERFNISITYKGLSDTISSKKWQPYIQNFRDSYLAKVKSVPIANKRIRLDDLERERQRLNKLIKACPTERRADKSLYLSLVTALRQINAEAREEMEKKPHLFQNVNIQTENMSDDAIHQRKQELIRKLRGTLGGGTFRASTDAGGTGEEET